MEIAAETLQKIGDLLHNGLSGIRDTECMGSLGPAILAALDEVGIHADRVQLPMTKFAGFRHPRYGVIVITVRRDHPTDVRYVDHDTFAQRETFVRTQTPYAAALQEPGRIMHYTLSRDRAQFGVFEELTGEGYEHYVGTSFVLPDGAVQPMSLCTFADNPWPEDFAERLKGILPMISLAFYNAYQLSVSQVMASTYLGRETGKRVLVGEIRRGTYREIHAGILFCDIRGFTRMSAELGGPGTVERVNGIFECIGGAVTSHGGEILKFIGDAMLVIFNAAEGEDEHALSQRMIRGAWKGLDALEKRNAETGFSCEVGFGIHIGDVFYGNIGTEDRLDFTVMGEAVNLAARLESLCAQLGMRIVASSAVGKYGCALDPLGDFSLKGIPEPVPLFGAR